MVNLSQKTLITSDPLLKFERTTLQITKKNTNGYVFEILKNITEMTGDTDINKNCNVMVITTLEEYIRKFKHDGRPTYLYNKYHVNNHI